MLHQFLLIYLNPSSLSIEKSTYLTLPAAAADVANPLLKTKLRLAAVKALREAELNNLGRTIVNNFGNF